MPYDILATAKTPALVIYLLDVSSSMQTLLGGKRRIDIVHEALGTALRQMVFRSTKGSRVSPRYRIAMLAYSDHVFDLLDGIKSVDQVATLGVPKLVAQGTTEAAKAFAQAEKILQAELPSLVRGPAPLICHMTDGEATGEDPDPIVRSIMQMAVPDGNVLVENIFISDRILDQPINNPQQWQGILMDTPLKNEFASKLQALSSPLPESYRAMMLESNYHLARGALMLLPGMSPELVAMGFQMSAATPVH